MSEEIEVIAMTINTTRELLDKLISLFLKFSSVCLKWTLYKKEKKVNFSLKVKKGEK